MASVILTTPTKTPHKRKSILSCKEWTASDIWARVNKRNQQHSESLLSNQIKKKKTTGQYRRKKLEDCRLRKAERAAERADYGVVTVEKVEDQEKGKPKRRTKNWSLEKIKRSKKIKKTKNTTNAMQQKKNEELLVQYIGDKDAVTECYENSRRVYFYKCPECQHIVREKLSRHLNEKHNIDIGNADMKQSRMRVLFLWIRSEKHNVPLPGPCEKCNLWFLRIDHHYKNSRYHSKMSVEEKKVTVKDVKKKCWSEKASQ